MLDNDDDDDDNTDDDSFVWESISGSATPTLSVELLDDDDGIFTCFVFSVTVVVEDNDVDVFVFVIPPACILVANFANIFCNFVFGIDDDLICK